MRSAAQAARAAREGAADLARAVADVVRMRRRGDEVSCDDEEAEEEE